MTVRIPRPRVVKGGRRVRAVDHRDGVRESPGEVASPTRHPRARFVLDHEAMDLIYPAKVRRAIGELVELVGPVCTGEDVHEDPSLLAGVEVLISGWGGPCLTEAVLDVATELRVVFYGAGSVRTVVTDAVWRKGIRVTSAVSANAAPVVEFTVAQIVLCLKRVWQHAFELRQARRWVQSDPGAGGYRSSIGIVSVGEIGRRVIERLALMDVEIIAYDLEPDRALAKTYRVRYVSLEELFTTSDVVSVHTPLLDETRGLIGEKLLRMMKPGASLINTARGAVIHEPGLVHVFTDRPDLFAILDVTDPEPPAPDGQIWALPNVVLTPHIAGSRGGECARMGRWMLEEMRRYRAGEPLRWPITPDSVGIRA